MKSSVGKQLKNIINFIIKICDKITDNHIMAYAAQASFFVIISSVPFAMLLISLLRVIIPVPQYEVVSWIDSLLPAQISELGVSVINEVYSNVSVSVLSVTAVTLLWSSSRGLKSICLGLRKVYGTDSDKGVIFNTVFSLISTVIFMALMIASVGILVFGKYLGNLIFGYFPALEPIIGGLFGHRRIIFFAFLTFIFMLAYKLLARNRIPFKSHFIGAAAAALCWLLFSFFYSIYIENFSNYSYVYGSLTAVILLMLWLYTCMILLLLGAQINVWIYDYNLTLKRLAKYIFSK